MALADSFLVNRRLDGFFQHPTPFAIFPLAGFILTLSRKVLGWQELLCLVVLLLGIALPGSHTVFILMAAAAVPLQPP